MSWRVHAEPKAPVGQSWWRYCQDLDCPFPHHDYLPFHGVKPQVDS